MSMALHVISNLTYRYRNGNLNYQRKITRTAVSVIRKGIRARRSWTKSKSENMFDLNEYRDVTTRTIST